MKGSTLAFIDVRAWLDWMNAVYLVSTSRISKLVITLQFRSSSYFSKVPFASGNIVITGVFTTSEKQSIFVIEIA